MKVAPDPVMSEVVRQRLELLLAEVRPRHAAPEDSWTADEGRPPEGGPGERTGPTADRPRNDTGPPADGPGPGAGPQRGTRAPAPTEPVTGAPARVAPRRLDTTAGAAAQLGRRALEFTREHLTFLVVVLLVGCAWTVYSLLQARSTPVAVAAPPSVVASPAPTATAAPAVLVHVVGAVREPGLVRLPAGSRVADAIAAAGGLRSSADAGELNLAAVVDDGAQVLIGTRSKPGGEVRGGSGAAGGAGGSDAAGSAGGTGAAAGGASPVSLNSATLEQLDALPGVGPVTARRILDWRTRHGRFTAVTELQEVEGIGPKTYADLAPHVRV